MKPLIFIDGEAGTTGLQIRQRLEGRSDLRFVSLDDTERKCEKRRAEAINDCDLAILCLPDDAARQAVSFVRNDRVRILDASSAHRTNSEWVYGLPELNSQQSEAITSARFVSNPGCYPTGAVTLIAPLVSFGILSRKFHAVVNATSGYSGAGKSLITRYEDETVPDYTEIPHNAYALHLEHKHISEMQVHSGLKTQPIFLPAVGRYRQGILMRVPVFSDDFSQKSDFRQIRKTLEKHYETSEFVEVVEEKDINQLTNLNPIDLNGSNNLRIYIFHNPDHNQIVLTAVYDNLGKGASGAAVQNMNLMLGLTDKGRLDLRAD